MVRLLLVLAIICVAVPACVCNCKPLTVAGELPCSGADAGVFIHAGLTTAAACSVSLDGGVLTFTLSDVSCTVFGDVWPVDVPCDVTSFPPGTYAAATATGAAPAVTLPLRPDSGLSACPSE